jgi:hypothetical protein
VKRMFPIRIGAPFFLLSDQFHYRSPVVNSQ